MFLERKLSPEFFFHLFPMAFFQDFKTGNKVVPINFCWIKRERCRLLKSLTVRWTSEYKRNHIIGEYVLLCSTFIFAQEEINAGIMKQLSHKLISVNCRRSSHDTCHSVLALPYLKTHLKQVSLNLKVSLNLYFMRLPVGLVPNSFLS